MVTIYAEWKHPKTGATFPAGTRFAQIPLPDNKWYWIKPGGARGSFVLDGIPGS